MQDEDIPYTEDDKEVLVTRAFFNDKTKDKSWCPSQKQRTTEYDAIYWWLKGYAVHLTTLEQRPITVLQAAERAQTDQATPGRDRKGNLSIYKFMRACCAARKAAKEAAAAAAAAAEEEEAEVADDG